MTKQAINSRLDQLEKKQQTKARPLYVILQDGEPVPEGVKAYHPDASPDLWDEPEEPITALDSAKDK